MLGRVEQGLGTESVWMIIVSLQHVLGRCIIEYIAIGHDRMGFVIGVSISVHHVGQYGEEDVTIAVDLTSEQTQRSLSRREDGLRAEVGEVKFQGLEAFFCDGRERKRS